MPPAVVAEFTTALIRRARLLRLHKLTARVKPQQVGMDTFHSPQRMAEQLIHAMATWPPGTASAMFSPWRETIEAAPAHLLGKSQSLKPRFMEGHAA